MRKTIYLFALLAATTLHRPGLAQTGAEDPTGFVPLLNAARAERGLPPVAYDPGCASVAHENNRHQLVRGLGHHVLHGLGQVAAVGIADARAALAAWTHSPAHASLIYAPDLVAVGFSQLGGCCTASTRQGFAATHPAPAYQPAAPAGWAYQPATYTYPYGVQWVHPARRGRWRW